MSQDLSVVVPDTWCITSIIILTLGPCDSPSEGENSAIGAQSGVDNTCSHLRKSSRNKAHCVARLA